MQEISDLRLKVSEMDSERLQYEKKLKSTKVSFSLAKFFLNKWLHYSSVSNNISKIIST
jgi:hypothetical protein